MNEHAAFDRAHADLTPGKRAAALYKEARSLADDNIDAFVALLLDVTERANEISEGGDIYATGIRDICKKLGETATFRAKAILSITHDLRSTPLPHFGSLDEGDLTEELAASEDAPYAPPAAPPAAAAAPAAAVTVSFSPFAPLEAAIDKLADEPPKIFTLHNPLKTPAPPAPDDAEFSEIADRLAAFRRRAGGADAG